MKIFSISIKAIVFCLLLITSLSVFGQKSNVKKKHPKKTNTDTVKGAAYYFDAANDKAKSGDYVSAIDLFDKCISLDPNMYDGYYNRAYCKMHLNDYEAAIEDF